MRTLPEVAQLTHGRPGLRAAKLCGRPPGIWGALCSVLGIHGGQVRLGQTRFPPSSHCFSTVRQCLGIEAGGGCVSGCRYVEGASCRPHMVALSTSSASTCSHLVLWARRSSVEKVRGGGAGRTALRKRVASGRCCEFGFSPLCGARAQWPPALCTLSGLIFM